MSVGIKGVLVSRLQTSLILLLLNGKAKTKLAILVFLYCEEFVKKVISISRHAEHVTFSRSMTLFAFFLTNLFFN